jgi:HD superfamily phosphodiesterase
VETVAWARNYAKELLSPLGSRWIHSKTVAEKAAGVAQRIRPPDRDVLVAAAYLHDIGYAPALALTEFHPLDGGRHVRDLGQDRLANLVVHHGSAAEEAFLRDLSEALSEFARENSDLDLLLDYCDLTVGTEWREHDSQAAPRRHRVPVRPRSRRDYGAADGVAQID